MSMYFDFSWKNKWCSCRLTVKWQVSPVEQELLTVQKYLCWPQVLWGCSFGFCAIIFRILFVLFGSFSHCVVCRLMKVWYFLTFLNYTQMIDITPSGTLVQIERLIFLGFSTNIIDIFSAKCVATIPKRGGLNL